MESLLLEKGLCTSTQFKTELIGDAVQMEIFNCQQQQALHAWWGPGHHENGWSCGRVCAGVARNPVTFPRGGSGFQGGDCAGADFPVGGKK